MAKSKWDKATNRIRRDAEKIQKDADRFLDDIFAPIEKPRSRKPPQPKYQDSEYPSGPKIAPPAKDQIICEHCKFFPAAPHKGSIYREPGNITQHLCEFCRGGEDS